MNWLLLLCSLALAAALAAALARKTGHCAAERFWIFAVSLAAQPPVLAQLLTPFRLLAPGPWLALQACLALPLLFFLRPRSPRPRLPRLSRPSWPAAAAAVLIAAAALANLPLVTRAPINTWDEKNYHAPRAAHWMQAQSIQYFETANERENAYSVHAELTWFFWPVLFTRNPTAGRVLFSLALPLAAAGVWLLARRLGSSPAAAAWGAALYAAAPLSLFLARMLKPDHWSVFFLCGCAWWLAHALDADDTDGKRRALFWSGACLAVACASRFQVFAVLPGAGLVIWFAFRSQAKAFCAGLALACACSGLVFQLAANWGAYGTPAGSPAMAAYYTNPVEPSHLAAVAARAPLIFLDPPFLPWPAVRAALNSAAATWLNLTGGGRALAREDPARLWPGAYSFQLGPNATLYSTAGFLALAGLLAGFRRRARGAAAVWFMGTSLLFLTILLIRWQSADRIPHRFLLPAVALLLASILPRCGRLPASLGLSLALLTAWQPLGETWRLSRMWLTTPGATVVEIEYEPFAEISALVPSGSRILLFGMPSTRVYPLFNPRSGFSREVHHWGWHNWDGSRFRDLLARHRITHVVVEDDHFSTPDWLPPLDAGPLRHGLDSAPELERIALLSPRQRLYSAAPAGLPAATLRSLPESLPLLTAEAPLAFPAAGLLTPWPVESAGGATWTWLGSGEAQGLRLAVVSPAPGPAVLSLDAEPGFCRRAPLRTVCWRVNGGSTASSVMETRTRLRLPLSLAAGRNVVEVWVAEPAEFASPNGDARALLLRLHGGGIRPGVN
ncbi:MAG: glycosyltransferase family 39 protein [Candidatus Solibacter usitatus]|nr:glycosyltransferase family 39 protein [Candidatus Solibacter usitatus]